MIKELREEQVPRKELDRVFSSYDEQRGYPRKLDEVKQAQGNVYGARDFLSDLRERDRPQGTPAAVLNALSD